MKNLSSDGKDHINIYSRGKTELGRLLSNFAESPFNYPPYGKFKSVEGFWYWFLTGQRYDYLRNLSGWQAKKEGQKYRDDRVDKDSMTESQKETILEAIRCKLRQNKKIRILLKESTLPFEHYYEYGNNTNCKRIHLPQYQWIVDEIERIRRILQGKLEKE